MRANEFILNSVAEEKIQEIQRTATDRDKTDYRQGVAESVGTKNPEFSGWLAMSYSREGATKKFPTNVRSKTGRDLNKPMAHNDFDINDIEINDDDISNKLSEYLWNNFRLRSAGSGAGQGYSEHFWHLPTLRGFNNALELGKRLLAGESAIKEWFDQHNESLSKIGLPGYRVECWGGITSPIWHNDTTSDVIVDLNNLRAIYDGQAKLGDFWNKGIQGVEESQTAKAGIVQTEVYGTRAYHAKCMEPNCDWESRRYDKIQQAQAAAKKHSEKHLNKKGVVEGSEDYNGIQLSLEIEKDDEYVDDEDTDNQTIYVKATADGRELGHVLFTIDYDSQGMVLNPQDLEVDDRYRGQGIAATMYDYVKSKGYRIRRSGQQTDAGAGFWNKHKPGKNIWEQGVAESDEDDSKKLKGFHQSLGNAVRGRVSQMQANMAILKAQNPNTWLWEPGDIVYSAK
ncbi:MAG: hypothetical protein RLZZ196_2921, partial [Bacteroidota bacterium]